VSEERLDVLDPSNAGDVIAEGVAHHVRVHVRVDAGTRGELHDCRAQRLAGARSPREVAAKRFGARVAPALRRDHVLIQRDGLADSRAIGSSSGRTGIHRCRPPLAMSAMIHTQPARWKWRPCSPRSSPLRAPEQMPMWAITALAHRLGCRQERRGLGARHR
jgi:hypothetical protein